MHTSPCGVGSGGVTYLASGMYVLPGAMRLSQVGRTFAALAVQAWCCQHHVRIWGDEKGVDTYTYATCGGVFRGGQPTRGGPGAGHVSSCCWPILLSRESRVVASCGTLLWSAKRDPAGVSGAASRL